MPGARGNSGRSGPKGDRGQDGLSGIPGIVQINIGVYVATNVLNTLFTIFFI